jgi:hypothetical protein
LLGIKLESDTEGFNDETDGGKIDFVNWDQVTVTDLKGWVFEERIQYYPEILGNYTLSMSDATQNSSFDPIVFNATFMFVEDNIIVDFHTAGQVFSLGCYYGDT